MAAIVGLVASVLGPTIELGKCIVEPIKRQFNYLCCFNSNIESLRDEAKKLDDERVGVQMRVDDAKRNTHEIVPAVETWLKNVNEIQSDISGIESKIPNLKRGFWAIKPRFLLSRKAKKMVIAMKELQDHCKFDHVSQPALPVAMGSIPLGQTYEIQSRKHIEEDIMASLREGKVNIMGIYGMGGVGKTTMAKKIMKRVRDENLFDEIVMAVVSKPVNMSKIQQEIAESLGMKLEVETSSVRAHKLRDRLMDTKTTLIVLDDLWERLNMEDLGIPHESCTILLTSRDRGVFKAMDVEKVFEVQTLSEVEAWSLFREKVGSACANDQSLFPIAQEITKECKGLPIALATVGVALKNERNKSLWEDALLQLKSSNPIDMPYFLTDVYSPLKLSYDFLDSEHARSIFLLCCLYPEDRQIHTFDLTIYGWGLGMFEGVGSFMNARNRVYALVELLKNRCLLLEGFDKYHVKMHDIVRDVAIFIASRQGLIEPNLSLITWPHEKSYSNCTWISSHQQGERSNGLPIGLVFPNLRLLLIQKSTAMVPYFLLMNGNLSERTIHLDDKFFEGMRKLNVLTIRDHSLESLPHTTQLLSNLRTLRLSSCVSIKTISVIVELVNLESLICDHCDSLKELPVEIGRLNRLKLLDLSFCHRLQTIAPGIISSLVRLENLWMLSGFKNWEGEKMTSIERQNARLSELESLLSLTSLSMSLNDPSLAAEQIHLSPNVVEFEIQIGGSMGERPYSPESDQSARLYIRNIGTRNMSLMLERKMTLGDWVHKLLMKTEDLRLYGEGSFNLFPLLPECHDLKFLSMSYIYPVEKENQGTSLFDGRSYGTTTIFPLLEYIHIDDVGTLEEIYNGPIPSISSFKNLKILELWILPALKNLWKPTSCQYVVSRFCNLSSIHIGHCDRLHNLFWFVKASDYVLQHESLSISNCDMMEQVFLCNEDANDDKDTGQSSLNLGDISFPKLKYLYLYQLPRLTSFCQRIESIEFTLLTEITILNCPQLKSLVSSCSSSRGIYHDDADYDHDDDSLHLFCNPKVVFGMLNTLKISGYDEITSITSLWCRLVPVDFFIQLESLVIENCGNITSLFSFSIAQNLVNLKRLTIERFGEMVKVIDDDEDCASHETPRLSLFLKLESLRLTKLSKLKSFCEWRSALCWGILFMLLVCKKHKYILKVFEKTIFCISQVIVFHLTE